VPDRVVVRLRVNDQNPFLLAQAEQPLTNVEFPPPVTA
jgi:hypothetical protein